MVKAAHEKVDLISDFPAFLTYDRNGKCQYVLPRCQPVRSKTKINICSMCRLKSPNGIRIWRKVVHAIEAVYSGVAEGDNFVFCA